MALQKILRTGVRKVRGNVTFLCDLAHSFTTNAKQDKTFILTLMLYCTSKSYKIQVAKLATKQKF